MLKMNKKISRFMIKLFISYFIIVIICIGGTGLLSYRFERQKMIDQTIKSNSELLDHHRNTVDRFVLGSIDSLSLYFLQNIPDNPNLSFYFTNPPEYNIIGLTSVHNYLIKLRAATPIASNISIYYKSCDFLISAKNGVTYPGSGNSLDKVDKDCMLELYNTNETYLWSVVQKNVTDSANPQYKQVIIFTRKIPSPGGFFSDGGMIGITVEEDILYNIIKGSAPVDFGSIFIVDGNGTIITHSQKDDLSSNIEGTVYGDRILKSSQPSGYFLSDINGVKNVVSFTSSGYNDWKFVTINPLTNFSERASYFGNMAAIVSVITFLFAIMIALVSTRQFSSPLRKLSDMCKSILKLKPYSSSKDEYAIIGSTLDMLAATVQKQEASMEVSLPVIKDHFVNSLISSTYKNMVEIDEKMDMLDIDFPYIYYAVAVLQFGRLPSYIDIKTYEYLKLESIEMIGEVLLNQEVKYAYTQNNNQIILVLNFSDKSMNIKDATDSLLGYLHTNLHLNACIGAGSSCDSIISVQNSFQEAVKCLKYHYLHPETSFLSFRDISQWELNKPVSGKQLFEKFCSSLKSQERKSSLENIKALILEVRRDFYEYNYAMKLLTKCISYLDDTVTSLKVDISDIVERDIHTTFNLTNNINELEKWLVELIERIFAFIDSKRSDRSKELIQNAMEYISRNIMSPDISLISVAEVMGITSTYLSHIFKDETGMNFVDYLIDTRLEAAREMLINDNLTIEKISIAVGYSSPQYFIKKFKAKYNMTPKEYRMANMLK